MLLTLWCAKYLQGTVPCHATTVLLCELTPVPLASMAVADVLLVL